MKLVTLAFTAMASPCELRAYGRRAGAVTTALEAARDEVYRIEAKYSRYRDDSVVSRINAAAGSGRNVAVDEETAGLLDYAATAFTESDGLFDITSGVLRRVWNFKSGRVPAQHDIDTVLPLIGWQQVHWRAPDIRLPRPGMELDFGGFGKEYAVDRAAAVLEAQDIAHGLVDLGGDVRVVGPHPDGGAWRVGIRDPRTRDKAIARVELLRGAVATSGDYERAFVHQGKTYSHLLDPRNGWPVASGPASVSVLGERSLLAGTASTVAMLHGGGAQAWLDALGLPWLIVQRDGAVRRSAGNLHPKSDKC